MGFTLKSDEAVGAGIRRLVDEQLDSALAELKNAGETELEKDKAVHSARKRMKRVRAVVRLIREAISNEVFELENTAFRDAGGTLAEARDAAVLVQTLEGLKEQIGVEAYRSARKRLVARRRTVKKRVLEAGGGFEGVIQAAQEAKGRVVGWVIEWDGWAVLKVGLKRVYRDGREAMEAAMVGELAGHGAEMFHEWRKRVKDLWHHCEVLEKMWPAAMGVMAEAFHEQADLLGEEHDLAVLKGILEADAAARGETIAGAAEVIEAADRGRLKLQKAAKELGSRLFAEKPGAFVKRLGAYWKSWWVGGEDLARDERATAEKVGEANDEVMPPGAGE